VRATDLHLVEIDHTPLRFVTITKIGLIGKHTDLLALFEMAWVAHFAVAKEEVTSDGKDFGCSGLLPWLQRHSSGQ